MTSRFPSLAKAIHAVERLLEADEADFHRLVSLASEYSEIPVERILIGIDLSQIDLRRGTITPLLGKRSIFSEAILTARQRRELEDDAKAAKRLRDRGKIRSRRVELISSFIDAYERSGTRYSRKGADLFPELTVDLLRSILLGELPRGSAYVQLPPEYVNRVLFKLQEWASEDARWFFRDLFKLLGKLGCRVNGSTVNFVRKIYVPAFSEDIAQFVASMPPSFALDAFFMLEGPTNSQSIKSTQIIQRAAHLSGLRAVSTEALEHVMDQIDEPRIKMQLLSVANHECDGDQAERLAVRITRADWPARETKDYLVGAANSRVRGAIFRQLMYQSNDDRVIEVLRWLDGNRGAVGALSLEDAFKRIRSFEAGLLFIEEAGRNFANNQLRAVVPELERLATSALQKQKLSSICERLNYNPKVGLR